MDISYNEDFLSAYITETAEFDPAKAELARRENSFAAEDGKGERE